VSFSENSFSEGPRGPFPFRLLGRSCKFTVTEAPFTIGPVFQLQLCSKQSARPSTLIDLCAASRSEESFYSIGFRKRFCRETWYLPCSFRFSVFQKVTTGRGSLNCRGPLRRPCVGPRKETPTKDKPPSTRPRSRRISAQRPPGEVRCPCRDESDENPS